MAESQRIFLREWREARKLSLTVMAGRTPFNKSTLSRVETGKTPYYRDIIEHYARVLGVQPYMLFHRPPGRAEELFVIIGELMAEDRADDLQRLTDLTKIFLKER